MNKKLKFAITDIEVLPNSFICGVKPLNQEPIQFKIDSSNFDLVALVEYFTSGEYIFVGYNINHYDKPIINMMITKYRKGEFKDFKPSYLDILMQVHELSTAIIRTDNREYRQEIFPTIDLMTMLASKALRVGLKPLQISMCYPNVEEMVVDWESWATKDIIDNVATYNINDLNSTENLLGLLREDLKFRMEIQRQYGIKCLSKDGVGIGVDIVTKYVCAELGIPERYLIHQRDNYEDGFPVKDFLLPELKFKSEKFKNVLNTYKNLYLDKYGAVPASVKLERDGNDKAIAKCHYNDLTHVFGLGGIHSANRPRLIEPDPATHVLIDADVASMYPAMAIAWGFGPKGFKDVFVKVLTDLRAKRIIAKREGDKITDKTYKLALNSILGNLRNEYSPYFAPEANTAICVNGQLFLAMLIERLEDAGIEIVMSNTDGVSSLIPIEKLDLYYEICKEWEKESRLELEFVEYEKMAILAVNDYVAYTKNNYNKKTETYESYSDVANKYSHPNPEDILEFNFAMIKNTDDGWKMLDFEKQKGLLLTYPRVGKGLDSLIVAKAFINYYGKGTPIEETIRNFKSIYDYVIYQKVGRQYEVQYGTEKVQHINRFYVSNRGRRIIKVKDGKPSNLLKGWDVNLANDLRGVDINDPSNFDINYQYYISRTQKLLDLIEPKQLSLF